MKVYTDPYDRLGDYSAAYYTYEYDVYDNLIDTGAVCYRIDKTLLRRWFLKSSAELYEKYEDMGIRRLHTVIDTESGKGKEAIAQIDFCDGTMLYMDDPRTARVINRMRRSRIQKKPI